jgi:hypothetical protein
VPTFIVVVIGFLITRQSLINRQVRFIEVQRAGSVAVKCMSLYDLVPANLLVLLAVLVPLVIWSFFWKAVGLWFSSKNGNKVWFVVFLFVNLAGLLELYYLYSRRCWPFRR